MTPSRVTGIRVVVAGAVVALMFLAIGRPTGQPVGGTSARSAVPGGASTYAPSTSAGVAGLPSAMPVPTTNLPNVPTPAPTIQVPDVPAPLLDTAQGPDRAVPVPPPARIEVYPGQVSILPGEPLELHVSTHARTYRYTVSRVDAGAPGGAVQIFASGSRSGRDYDARATVDALLGTVRANWPVTDVIKTPGWPAGVYLVAADAADGTVGRALFVVRTKVLDQKGPVFVFTAMTYEAYNEWGGANLYHPSRHAVRVSFERPQSLDGGLGPWDSGDARILAWLQVRGIALQYTTDYDLALHPPVVAPRLVILPRHMEYVTASLRNWVEQHINQRGDMNLMSFGANGFYWQVRMAPARTTGAPMDIVCYKSATTDPYAAANPALTTVRWRDAPINRPESQVLGAQYVAILGNAWTRFPLTVTAAMPPELLVGTGWKTGTVIRGLLVTEGDRTDPGSGGISILVGHATNRRGGPVAAGATIRQSAAGSRVFDAGSFGWADGLSPARVDLGIAPSSFDRFNRNVLAWLGVATSH